MADALAAQAWNGAPIQVRGALALRPTQYTLVLSATVVAEAEVVPDHLDGD